MLQSVTYLVMTTQNHRKKSAMVRSAGMADLPSIAQLYHRVWHDTHGPYMPRAERDARDEAFFLNRMASLMPNIVVGQDERGIIGFAAWKGSRLGQVFLDPSARGSGLAQSLMTAAERGLRDQDIAEAELHCLVGNERAKRFYERAGWHVSAVVAEAVQSDTGDGKRDFWVMRKRLQPGTAHYPSLE